MVIDPVTARLIVKTGRISGPSSSGWSGSALVKIIRQLMGRDYDIKYENRIIFVGLGQIQIFS